jgi:hypothetical protein
VVIRDLLGSGGFGGRLPSTMFVLNASVDHSAPLDSDRGRAERKFRTYRHAARATVDRWSRHRSWRDGENSPTWRACSTRCRAGSRPGVALVTGTAGIGKTRLLRELCGSRLPGPSRHAVRGYEMERMVPLAAAAGQLDALVDVAGEGVRLAALLGREGQPGDRLRLFEAARRCIFAEPPTIVVVDDLQWVDEISVALVHYLLRAAESARLPRPSWSPPGPVMRNPPSRRPPAGCSAGRTRCSHWTWGRWPATFRPSRWARSPEPDRCRPRPFRRRPSRSRTPREARPPRDRLTFPLCSLLTWVGFVLEVRQPDDALHR